MRNALSAPILPDAILGVLGGGQLGRMFTIAARTMGYRVMVLDPDPACPAGQFADTHLIAGYQDSAALAKMSRDCAAITTEFENVPAATLASLAEHRPVKPGAAAVRIAQNRVAEKQWLMQHGFATAPFAIIAETDDIANACARIGFPAVLKVSRFGYDGKGQARVGDEAQVAAAFAEMGGELCVLESLLTLECELSVVLGRNEGGEIATYPVSENIHESGILAMSIVPARVVGELTEGALEMATAIATRLDYCGVLAVEFFVVSGGHLVVNEIAPRPHNSGHYTLDACLSSQFEMQVRTLCNLPLGATMQHTPAVMVNLLGEVWNDGSQPHWEALLRHPETKLHLYGKQSPRPGRKMGHYTCLDVSLNEALAQAIRIRAQLRDEDRPR
ncbi:MAG TPA: 5-(carboxyamino)imidazole ribonucleotide synthase [Burkholderiales bacterium]|nr:5-(carboxyamino)imidazole ribonucleotide synthase [Burkholderiales bacterium]